MITLLVWIVIIGLIDYAVFRWTPIPAGFKTLIYVVSIIFCILLALNAFGFSLGSLGSPHVR